MIYLTLFCEFFKVGLFTFGGGFAMIPLIQEIVIKYGWLDESTFYDLIGVCESTPGPIAVNMATYIGAGQGGIIGSIVATFGVVLPSFIIILLIASALQGFTKNKYFKSFMQGVKPIIVALILETGIMLLIKTIGFVNLKEFAFDIKPIIIISITTVLYFVYKKKFNKKMSSIITILLCAVLGIVVNVILKGIL